MKLAAEIAICYQIDESCVKTAVETLRKALGYRKASFIDKGMITNGELASYIGKLFPRHKIVAYLSEEVSKEICQSNVTYGGSKVLFDKEPCLWMFSYSDSEGNSAHMVIGYPVVYDACTLIAAYKIML